MFKRKEKYIEFYDSLRKVFISNTIFRTFNKFSKKISKIESGGILLGYYYSYYDHIIKITLPSKYDLSSINSFVRSKHYAQLQINTFWNRSNGILIYLGEWHTHNEINPVPSLIDKSMIKKVFKETIMEIELLYLIIVGKKNNLWVGRQNSEGLVPLKQL